MQHPASPPLSLDLNSPCIWFCTAPQRPGCSPRKSSVRGFPWVPSLSFLLPLPCLTPSSPLLPPKLDITFLRRAEREGEVPVGEQPPGCRQQGRGELTAVAGTAQSCSWLSWVTSSQSGGVPRALAASDTTQAVPSCPPAPPCQCHEHQEPPASCISPLSTQVHHCAGVFFSSLQHQA